MIHITKQFDVIVTDLDGTLTDEFPRQYACYADIVVSAGGVPLDYAEYRRLKRNKVPRNLLLAKSAYRKDEAVFALEWLRLVETERYLSLVHPYHGVIDMLGKWRLHANALVLCTARRNHTGLSRQLSCWGLRSVFDRILICDPLQHGSKGAVLAVSGLGASGVLVGDTEEDAAAAKLCGYRFIGVLCGVRNRRTLGADVVYDNPRDIDWDGVVRVSA